jgi:DNA-binding LacI/PurR family transcriptional regulator
MADVAAAAGVSHQTVSRVLNDHPLVKDATRQRVVEAIGALGYRRNNAARALATNRSGLIGLVTTHMALHGPSMIAGAVQEAAHAAGYGVALIGLPQLSAETLRDAVDRLLNQSVEAAVVSVAQREALATVDSLELPIPVVTAQGVQPDQPMAAGTDQLRGGYLATAHLLDGATGAVAHVAGPLDWVEAGQRRDGWLQAHRDRGAPVGPELVGDWSARSGYQAGRSLGADPGVGAVFAGNDAMALGVLRALHELGRAVPEDVRVVGFDDMPEAEYFWPPLSTVSQDFSAIGQHAVDLALRALSGEKDATSPLVDPELIVRGSSAH